MTCLNVHVWKGLYTVMYCIIIMSLPETDYKIRNPDLLGVATLGGSSFEALRNPVVVDVEVTRGSLYADRWCSSSKTYAVEEVVGPCFRFFLLWDCPKKTNRWKPLV